MKFSIAFKVSMLNLILYTILFLWISSDGIQYYDIIASGIWGIIFIATHIVIRDGMF